MFGERVGRDGDAAVSWSLIAARRHFPSAMHPIPQLSHAAMLTMYKIWDEKTSFNGTEHIHITAAARRWGGGGGPYTGWVWPAARRASGARHLLVLWNVPVAPLLSPPHCSGTLRADMLLAV